MVEQAASSTSIAFSPQFLLCEPPSPQHPNSPRPYLLEGNLLWTGLDTMPTHQSNQRDPLHREEMNLFLS